MRDAAQAALYDRDRSDPNTKLGECGVSKEVLFGLVCAIDPTRHA
jgi:hypothetical protein